MISNLIGFDFTQPSKKVCSESTKKARERERERSWSKTTVDALHFIIFLNLTLTSIFHLDEIGL